MPPPHTMPRAEWAQSTPSSRPTPRPTSSGESDTGPGLSMEDKKVALPSQSEKLEILFKLNVISTFFHLEIIIKFKRVTLSLSYYLLSPIIWSINDEGLDLHGATSGSMESPHHCDHDHTSLRISTFITIQQYWLKVKLSQLSEKLHCNLSSTKLQNPEWFFCQMSSGIATAANSFPGRADREAFYVLHNWFCLLNSLETMTAFVLWCREHDRLFRSLWETEEKGRG